MTPTLRMWSYRFDDEGDYINSILNDMNADHPGDIIADILHWCEANSEDFDNLMWIAKNYYLEEKEMENGKKKIIEAEKIIAKKLRGHLF